MITTQRIKGIINVILLKKQLHFQKRMCFVTMEKNNEVKVKVIVIQTKSYDSGT